MASIILSFIGSQDPYSEKNHEEGSLVTLVRHLISQSQEIRKICLLYTVDTQPQAELTKDWLTSELKIKSKLIDIFPVSPKLSDDPIDVELALKEAYYFLSKIIELKEKNDIIEFNSSSGTPAMKTAWGILQASGSWDKSNLWQVRNPFQMKPHQSRVLVNNVNVVKNQSDLKVIKKQLFNYNYSGALQTLESSDLENKISQFLLQYASSRLSFNFDEAFTAINNLPSTDQGNWLKQINQLRQKQTTAILSEVYYKAEIKLNQKQYADFLILLFTFQENLLRYLVKKMLLTPDKINKNWKTLEDSKIISDVVEKHDDGKLWCHLQRYKLSKGEPLRVDFKSSNRKVLRAIIEYDTYNFSKIIPAIDYLESYCKKRNDYIHNIEGVSAILDEEQKAIKKHLQQILQQITNFSKINPFDSLNEQIINQLTPLVRG